jgi:hypothetical protein
MKKYLILFLIAIILILTSCSSATLSSSNLPQVKPSAIPSTQAPATSTQDSAAQPIQLANAQSLELPELTDNQGAVIVIAKPVGLDSTQDRLSFEISLDTHSVDLSMDLAALATLTTDNGQSVQATLWDAEPGGHHVLGTLVFPASIKGKSMLDGASKLTLTLKDVDAPERVFVWDLK